MEFHSLLIELSWAPVAPIMRRYLPGLKKHTVRLALGQPIFAQMSPCFWMLYHSEISNASEANSGQKKMFKSNTISHANQVQLVMLPETLLTMVIPAWHLIGIHC
jgi:hypothetical protein